MTLFKHPSKGVVNASDELTEFLGQRGFKPAGDPAEAGELKGQALDEALRSAELPLSGSADEKRARLEEHRAAQLVVDQPPVEDDTTDPSQGQ